MIMNHDRYVTNLIGDANDVANKLPDRVFKTIDTGDQVCLCRDSIYKSCRFPIKLVDSSVLPERGSAARRP